MQISIPALCRRNWCRTVRIPWKSWHLPILAPLSAATCTELHRTEWNSSSRISSHPLSPLDFAWIRVLSTWKLNAFTCFAASSWGERIVEVDACGVQTWFWLLILLPAFLHVWNLPNVSVPLGIGLCWVLPFWNLEMWLCWNDEGDWWRGVLFFHFRVSPGYRQSIAGNTWVVLPCLVLSLLLLLLLLLLLALLVLLLLLLLHTFPLPSCVRHRGHTQQSSLAGRSGWQQPCVLDTLALSGIVWTASVLAPVSLVGRFTLTVVVVKFASHCVFQQNHSK